MKGMILDFTGGATVEAAVYEYMTLHKLSDERLSLPGSQRKLAELIESGKGIPREETLQYLVEVYGAPQFKSPAQRRWFFATHPEGTPGGKEDKGKEPGGAKEKGKGDRWSEIMQAARDSVKSQPKMTGDELIIAINGAVEPDLTESEENRVRELVSPERTKKLVGPPERTPREERTPEIEELIGQEWARIQEERKVEKEKKEERQAPEKGPQNRPKSSPGKGMVPPFVQPGIPHRGAEKEGYLSQKDFFCKKYCDIADAVHWRAFVQAVTLVRSGIEDSCIKETIENEYPRVDVDMVLKAAKDFIKQGEKDPYISGGTLAMRLIRQGSSNKFISTVYQNLRRGGIGQEYLKGFRACFSP